MLEMLATSKARLRDPRTHQPEHVLKSDIGQYVVSFHGDSRQSINVHCRDWKSRVKNAFFKNKT